MNPHNIDLTQSNLEGPIVALNVLYNGMPATSGCETCKEVNGDNAFWCCLLPETMVYTEIGPVPICDIKVGSRVWTKSGLKEVVRVGSRKINEEIVEIISCYGRKMRLTKNHKVLCDTFVRKNREKPSLPKYVESNELLPKSSNKLGHYLIFPKIKCGSLRRPFIDVSDVSDVFVDNMGNCYNSSACRGIPLGNDFCVGEDEAWILGLYLAEGCTEGGSVNFNIHEDETYIFQKVVSFAESCGLYVSWKINRGKSLTMRIFSSALSKFFKGLLGQYCDKKQIHEKLMTIILGNKALCKSLCDGYYAGDGTKKLPAGTEYSVITTSKSLANQVLFLNFALGRFCGIYVHSRKGKKTSYTLKRSKGKFFDYVETSQDFRVPIKKKSEIHYKGKVWDIEVKDEESFLTECGEVHNCKTQNPSLYYVEFLQVLRMIGENWSNSKKTELILRAVRNYLDNSLSKGCVFFDGECTIYIDRPFACRMYGVISKENWDKRWETLKERQGDQFEAKPQCSLVIAEEEITPEMESKWFLHTRKSEERIGLAPEIINFHDLAGGSYRTFHDHLLLEFFGEDLLSVLTHAKMTDSTEEEVDLLIEELRKQLNEQTLSS